MKSWWSASTRRNGAASSPAQVEDFSQRETPPLAAPVTDLTRMPDGVAAWLAFHGIDAAQPPGGSQLKQR